MSGLSSFNQGNAGGFKLQEAEVAAGLAQPQKRREHEHSGLFLVLRASQIGDLAAGSREQLCIHLCLCLHSGS